MAIMPDGIDKCDYVVLRDTHDGSGDCMAFWWRAMSQYKDRRSGEIVEHEIAASPSIRHLKTEADHTAYARLRAGLVRQLRESGFGFIDGEGEGKPLGTIEIEERIERLARPRRLAPGQ